jgi:hypothetical protein
VKLCSSTSLVRRLPAIPCISLGNSVRGAVRRSDKRRQAPILSFGLLCREAEVSQLQ